MGAVKLSVFKAFCKVPSLKGVVCVCKTLVFLLKSGQTINLCVYQGELLSAASAVRVLLYQIKDPVLKPEKRESSHSERLATVASSSRSHTASVTAGKKAKLSIFSSANMLRNIIKGVKMLDRETVKPV